MSLHRVYIRLPDTPSYLSGSHHPHLWRPLYIRIEPSVIQTSLIGALRDKLLCTFIEKGYINYGGLVFPVRPVYDIYERRQIMTKIDDLWLIGCRPYFQNTKVLGVNGYYSLPQLVTGNIHTVFDARPTTEIDYES